MSSLPISLAANPRLDRWVRFEGTGTIWIGTGKIEMGQGIITALSQIAAEELDVPIGRIRLVSGDSVEGPGEGYTASSWSIEHSGAAIRLACAEVRAMALAEAARRLECEPLELDVEEGSVFKGGEQTGLDYWKLADGLDLTVEASGMVPPKPVESYRLVGTDVARLDLPAKLTGSGFIQDISEPGMLHARSLRQPGRDAVLETLDTERIARRAGKAIRIVRNENFVAFVDEDETAVARAATAAEEIASWRNARELLPEQARAEWIASQSSDDRHFGAPPAEPGNNRRESLSVSRGFVSHGSIAPSCALAKFEAGKLTVWSHAQGMHPLRAAIAKTTGLPIDQVACYHVQGAGCYGHNGADDAALDAALVALEIPDTLIRLQWRREEEFGHEPLSPAMKVTVHAELDAEGRPIDWMTEIWSPTHGARPGIGGAYLLGAEALAEKPPAREPFDVPEDRGGGATRNGTPIYDIPATRITYHLIHDCPVRTSSLRGLGATPNVFAIEGLIDRLADDAGIDPLDYRMSLLADQRAKAVLETAGRNAGWSKRGEAGTGRGMGIGLARYKNKSAYAAMVAEVEVEEAVRVLRVYCAVDAGLVINPDGLRNQVEGNIVQAISWALFEEVGFDNGRVSTDSWETYPVIRFSDIPEIDVTIVDPPAGAPSLGVGECAGGPAVAAIGNAVAHALGARINDLPMTRDRIMAALLE